MGSIVLSERGSSGARLRWSLAGFAAGLALVILLLAVSGASGDGILSALSLIPWPAYVAIAATQAVIVVLAAWKWRIVLTEILDGRTVPVGAAVGATATGALIGQVISIQVSTPIARAWTARRHGISARAAAATSLFEQALELLTLAVAAAASIALAVSGGQVWVAGLVMLALLAAGTYAIRPTLAGGGWAVARLPVPERFAAGRTQVALALAQAAAQRPAILRRLMAISLMRYVALLGLNVGIVLLILPGADPVGLVVAFPLILLLSSLPFLPAGLGAAEVSWAGVLVAQGFGPAEATEAAIALRVVSLFSFLLIYPVLFFAGRRSAAHSV